ncbi:MAG: hypothetical protein AAFR77_16570 [Cyanobacteria bacterium J06631_2]
MKNLPPWIPSFNAWMSAILLLLLVRGIKFVLRGTFANLNYEMFNLLSSKSYVVLYLLVLLSPIVVIAIAHNLLHLFLDQYLPDVETPEVTPHKSLFPCLMSWWEGLYGWLAIAITMILSTMITIIIFSPNYYSSAMNSWWLGTSNFFNPTMLIRLICVAYLYQFEQLVRTHLIAVGAGSRS